MKQKQEIRIVQGKERKLEYILTRKSVKNLNMRVKSDGTIHVSANRLVPVKYIDNFVLSHEKTLIKALDKYEKIKKAYDEILSALCEFLFYFCVLRIGCLRVFRHFRIINRLRRLRSIVIHILHLYVDLYKGGQGHHALIRCVDCQPVMRGRLAVQPV